MSEHDHDAPDEEDDAGRRNYSEEAAEWIRAYFRENSTPSDPWVHNGQLKSAAKRDDSVTWTAVDWTCLHMEEEGEIFNWHGRLARPDPEVLRAISNAEGESETPRKGLIGKANTVRLRKQETADDSDGDGDDDL